MKGKGCFKGASKTSKNLKGWKTLKCILLQKLISIINQSVGASYCSIRKKNETEEREINCHLNVDQSLLANT